MKELKSIMMHKSAELLDFSLSLSFRTACTKVLVKASRMSVFKLSRYSRAGTKITTEVRIGSD